MRLFFSYLWQSPLVRLTMFWFLLAIVGVSLFSWKLLGMRKELLETLQKTDAYIQALHSIEKGKGEEKSEITTIFETIEKFRPSVPELLDFVRTVEQTAETRKIELTLTSLLPSQGTLVDQDKVSYRLKAKSSLESLSIFIKDFEKLPYAIQIESFSLREGEEASFELDLTFILFTQLI